MQEDGPGGVDEDHETGLRVQDTRDGSTGTAADVQSQRDITDATCPAILPATCPNTHSPNLPELGLKGTETPEKLQEILIQNPDGEGVPKHEIWWVSNPHSEAGGDNLQLLEAAPGHYLYAVSPFATNLCEMAGTDPRSQFYKAPATGKSRPAPELPYLRGNGKTIKKLEFYASRRQARATEEKEQTATTSPGDITTAPSPNQKQGRPVTNLGVPSVSQGPNLTETEAIPHDHNLFYKNGNPKPITNMLARPLARGLTSKARKRQGGWKRNRRRNRRGRPSDEVSEGPQPHDY